MVENLSKRKWSLVITKTHLITLDPGIMDYVNSKTGYDFAQRLAKRSAQLHKEIKEFAHAIWPVIVREEDMQLIDGYCHYAALKTMNVSKIYAYVGAMVTN